MSEVVSVLGRSRECRCCVLLGAIMAIKHNAALLIRSFRGCLVWCLNTAIIFIWDVRSLSVMTLRSFLLAMLLWLLLLLVWCQLLHLRVVGDACDWHNIVVSMKGYRCDWLVSIISQRQNWEVALLSVFHHDVLIEGDLMSSKNLLITTCLLLLVHGWSRSMVRGSSFTVSLVMCCISIVWVSPGILTRIWIVGKLFELCFILNWETG